MSPTQVREVLQFKVALTEVRPVVWRRIQVPAGYTFWDLHVAVQDAMGWLDYHLHEFTIHLPDQDVRIGIPDEDGLDDEPVLPGWEVPVARYFGASIKTADYCYDFGDNWLHTVTFEKGLSADLHVKYPRCVAGKRHGPPEDCGGPWGFRRLLRILANPRHREHADMLDWVGGRFDSKAFEPSAVRFDNPRKRWKIAFG